MSFLNKTPKVSFIAAFGIMCISLAACDDSTSASDNVSGSGNSGGAAASDKTCKPVVECPVDAISSAQEQNDGNNNSGTICDSRDGQIYKTVQIGNQIWIAQNMNYCASDSWCYDGKAENCDKYGRLYSWTSAMGVDKSYQKNYFDRNGAVKQGICPEGFQMTTQSDWIALNNYVEAYAEENSTKVSAVLRSIGVWDEQTPYEAGDALGFAALPGGRKDFMGFRQMGEEAFFWSAQEDTTQFGGPGNALIWTLDARFSGFGGGSSSKDSGLSIRCVKNAKIGE